MSLEATYVVTDRPEGDSGSGSRVPVTLTPEDGDWIAGGSPNAIVLTIDTSTAAGKAFEVGARVKVSFAATKGK